MPDDLNEKELMGMDPEKVYFLQRTQVIQELQESMLAWGKKRFWMMAIIISIIGLLGGNILIKYTVREIMEKQIEKLTAKTEKASLAAALANESTKKAKDATDKSIQTSEEYSREVVSLKKKAKTVDNQFEALRVKIESESERVIGSTKLDREEFLSRIQQLETVVKNLASISVSSEPVIASYEKTISKTKEAAQTSRNIFQERSNVKVFFWRQGKFDYLVSKDFADEASREGYKVDIWPKQFPPPLYSYKNETDLTIKYTSEAKGFLSNIKEIIDAIYKKNSMHFPQTKDSFSITDNIIDEKDPKYMNGKVIYIHFHIRI